MWSMHFIGLVLKQMGLKWSGFYHVYLGFLAAGFAQWKALKMIIWPPFKHKQDFGLGKKQLLLLALLIAMKKADTMPHIDLLGDKSLFKQCKKRRGKMGC